MKNKDLDIDRRYHVVFSKKCENEIKNKILKHYGQESLEEVFTQVQLKYVGYLKSWRKDLGGKNNFHNGVGGTYDSIALMCYYVVCKEQTSLAEIEEMEGNLCLSAFKKLKFVNCNHKIWKKMMYKAFIKAKKECDKWNDYKMNVAPYEKNNPIYYEFTFCPIVQFAKENNLLEVMPALCNQDFKAMEFIHAKLVRKSTCSNGAVCDYTIYGDKDIRLKDQIEYVDESGYRRNKPKL